MKKKLTRRDVLKAGVNASAVLAPSLLSGCSGQKEVHVSPPETFDFQISLAQWSLHRTILGMDWNEMVRRFGQENIGDKFRHAPRDIITGELDPLDFPRIARQEFGISAVDYVNVFYMNKVKDSGYVNQLKQRADDYGVKSLMIMCDYEGEFGVPDKAQRDQTVENHKKWVEAAAHLGCHAIRVNARGRGTKEEQKRYVMESLSRLAEFSDAFGINVLVENHWGLSSDAAWLADVMKSLNNPRIGTLPDFGNFYIDQHTVYDRYLGVDELMPYAKSVSAKTIDFKDNGMEATMDYLRLMKLVKKHKFAGYIGIEYEGNNLSEYDGIRATKALLQSLKLQLNLRK